MRSCKSEPQLLDILHSYNAITEKIAEYREDLEQLLQAILGLTVAMPNVSYAAILLLDEERSQFDVVATSGESPFTLDLKTLWDVSKLVKRPHVRTGKKLVINQSVDDSQWCLLNHKERELLGELVCYPLVIEQKTIGMACAYGTDFGQDILDLEEFSLWAKLASFAIEKSSLYNQIHRHLEITREELRRSQSQIIRSEKLISLAEIAMSVAHTIRNPVTVIGGLSRRLHRDLPEGDSKRQLSEMILSEASRLESVVKEFERFFSIHQISFQAEDLNRLAEEAADDFLSQCRGEPDLTLKRSLCKEPLVCLVDPDLLNRCLMHLLANALEASSEGNHIKLTTFREGKDAIIDVIDTGEGMSREEMDHVFDPFYSTKGHGAGMGLTFVHFVITEHSGQVELRSEKGVGTQFRIRLPLDSIQ